MSGEAIPTNRLLEAVMAIAHKQATGKLLITNQNWQWSLYFVKGNLLLATGGSHIARRWYRALAQHSRNFQIDVSELGNTEPWEYELLEKGLAENELNIEQARAIARTITIEVFFSIASQPNFQRHWSPMQWPTMPHHQLLFSLKEIQTTWQIAEKLWKNWQARGLGCLSPDCVPVVLTTLNINNRMATTSLNQLTTFFNGQDTLWDIAVKKNQSLAVATSTLHHFVKQGLVEMHYVPDLPSPIEQWKLAVAIRKNEDQKTIGAGILPPLIACIDDSPTVCAILEKILLKGGYRVIKISDPLQGVSTLTKHKPDLIFLDILMPKTDGYSLCTFLKKTTQFRHTPIIILTGQDGFVDRARSLLVGAADFLSKPPEGDKVLQVVAKHLHNSKKEEEENVRLGMPIHGSTTKPAIVG